MPILARSLLLAAAMSVMPAAGRAQELPSPSRGGAVPLPAPAEAQRFFLEERGRALGPLSLPQLRARAAAGEITAGHLVWKAGTARWVAARDLPEIAGFFPQTGVQPAPAAPPAAKKVVTLPVTPGGAPPGAAAPRYDLSTYLTGTWRSEGGKEGPLTYAFGADGTLARRVDTVAGGEPAILRGPFTVEHVGAGAVLLGFVSKTDAGGGIAARSGEKTLEIVDADTMREKAGGAVLRRTTRTVELRLEPAADAACGGGKILLSDDFRQVDEAQGAGRDNPSVAVEGGKVSVEPRSDRRFQFVYADTRLADGEVCVTAQIPRSFQNPADVIGGVIFWARDLGNYYGFAVSPTGNAGLVRQIDGRFEILVAFRKAEGLNPQPGARNVLRVILTAGEVRAYVNGVRFDGVRAQPSAGGGSVGFFVQSERARPDAWKFGRLVVSNEAEH